MERRLDLLNTRAPPYFRGFTAGGIAHQLNYTDRMAQDRPHRASFVASSVEPVKQAGKPEPGMVKFADSYCNVAHMLLAKEPLAPDLRYFEKGRKRQDVGCGHTGKHPDLEMTRGDRDFTDQLRMAVKTLHANGFVHGDLR